MALVTYGVNATVVLKYLLQWDVSNSNRPGTTDIDTDGEYLLRAAADLEDAMLEGGFDSSGISSANQPSAYYQLRGCLAERTALYYAAALGHSLGGEDILSEAWERNNDKLDDISSGKRIGEVTVTDGPREAIFVHGDDTVSTLNETRAEYDDVL
jgi:hypothetical protein